MSKATNIPESVDFGRGQHQMNPSPYLFFPAVAIGSCTFYQSCSLSPRLGFSLAPACVVASFRPGRATTK